MKKIKKILPVILMIMLILSVFSNVFAATDPSQITAIQTDAFDEVGKKVVGMIQAGGIIVSVAVLIVIGIKYMLGSAEEKAEYKKTLMPYFIGAILIFAASSIAKFIYDFANTL